MARTKRLNHGHLISAQAHVRSRLSGFTIEKRSVVLVQLHSTQLKLEWDAAGACGTACLYSEACLMGCMTHIRHCCCTQLS